VRNDPRHEEEQLDEAIEETFPASDAPANTVVTGAELAPDVILENARAAGRITDNRAANRLEMAVHGDLAVLNYERRDGAFVIVHTEVPPALRGRHIGEALVDAAFEAARRDGSRIIVLCPFVRALLRRHPQLWDRTAVDVPDALLP
jgi:uncharacterized protein